MKTWLESVSNRKNIQFLVIILEKHDSIHDFAKNSKSFLLDKIRFDFSDKVSLKLITLRLTPGENLSSIPECVNLISDCLFQSVMTNFDQIENNIKKIYAQVNMPGWNFFNFFLSKETLAISLADMGFFSDALVCYDELEVFHSERKLILSQDNVEFASILPSDNYISGTDIDSVNWKKFRQLIHQSQISLYEFQIYIFSRQLYLLLEIKDIAQILDRLKTFVCYFSAFNSVEEQIKIQWKFESYRFVLDRIKLDVCVSELARGPSLFLVDILFSMTSVYL